MLKKATEKKLRKRVRRGADWLDEKQPGWARRIKLRDLELMASESCVLGQLAESIHGDEADFDTIVFDDGCSIPTDLRHLGMGVRRSQLLGFIVFSDVDHRRDSVTSDCHFDDEPYAWAVLNDAWRQEIRSRLGRTADLSLDRRSLLADA